MEPYFKVPAGAKILLGAPARPTERARSEALARLVASVGGVVEAHLPQCLVVGLMEMPAQVLVVVLESGSDPVAVLERFSN